MCKMVGIKNSDEFFILSFQNEYNETQYIKSYVYKHSRMLTTNGLNYKTYIYITRSIEEAKIWKKKNGAFRTVRNIIAPALNIPYESIKIVNITKQRIRMAKIIELGLLD